VEKIEIDLYKEIKKSEYKRWEMVVI